MTTAAALAKAFRAEARRTFNTAEIREINRRNRSPKYRQIGACASHDFADANMLMLGAFAAAFGREPDLTADADLDAINTAWTAVRATGF